MDILAELQYFFKAFLALFVIIDPFAVLPVYLSVSTRFPKPRRRAIVRKACLIAFIVLSIFVVGGIGVFKVFGITMQAFQIAGGILLFTVGMSQLSSTRQRVSDKEEEETFQQDDIAVFPLATPLLAGPGSISTAVLFATKNPEPFRIFILLLAVMLCMIASYYILKLASAMQRVLGHTGLNVLTRVMGVIVASIGIQFVITGLTQVVKNM